MTYLLRTPSELDPCKMRTFDPSALLAFQSPKTPLQGAQTVWTHEGIARLVRSQLGFQCACGGLLAIFRQKTQQLEKIKVDDQFSNERDPWNSTEFFKKNALRKQKSNKKRNAASDRMVLASPETCLRRLVRITPKGKQADEKQGRRERSR